MAVICAAFTLLGMAWVRMGSTATRDLTPVSNLVAHLHSDRVEGNFYLAGNLKVAYPHLDIRLTGATAAKGGWPVRLLSFGAAPVDGSVLQEGELSLMSPSNRGKPLIVKWHMVAAPT